MIRNQTRSSGSSAEGADLKEQTDRLTKVRAAWRTARRAGLRRSLRRVERIVRLRFLDPRLAERWYPAPELPPDPAPELSPAVRQALDAILELRGNAGFDHWDPAGGQLTLLNQAPFSLDDPVDWSRRISDDPLWDFQLQGWEWAWAELLDPSQWPALRSRMEHWSQYHRVGRGLAFEPYPTSRRLIVWSAAAAVLGSPVNLAASIAQQAAFLADHLERDLDNNHLIANAKALAWVGLLLPHLPEASRWRRLGSTILWEALEAQVNPDGGHEENSSGYHVAVWVDGMETALLTDAAGEPAPTASLAALERMTGFALALRRPDGRLPLLNDSNEDDPVPLDTAVALAARLFEREDLAPSPADERSGSVRAFPDTGYAVLRTAPEASGSTYLLFDAGALGPRHCPGHGHADALGIELWSRGRPILVDPGTFQYPSGEWRDYFRSTAAHSTATVDGENQSSFAGPFRVDHMAEARLLGSGTEGGTRWAEGEHHGYARLPDPVVHRRRVELVGAAVVRIEDNFDRPPGAGLARATPHTVALHFHLAPADVTIDGADRARARIGPDLDVEFAFESPATARLAVEQGWTSRSWYTKEPTPSLTYRVSDDLPIRITTRMTITGPP